MSFRAFCWTLLGMAPLLLARPRPFLPSTMNCITGAGRAISQLSYYDHPPMVAYLIRLSTELFGNTIFAIRLPGVVSGLTVIGVIGWLSRPRALFPLVVLSPVLTFAAILVTPDTPMLLFWASIWRGSSRFT